MTNDFALINSARQLESYVSREHYNIVKMKDNYKVPYALFETKAIHFNELLDTLNALYGSLIEGADVLFAEHYIQLHSDDDANNNDDEDIYDTTDYSVTTDDSVVEISTPTEVESVIHYNNAEKPPEPVAPPEQMQWQLDGFDSYESWVALKEVESAELTNDLDTIVSVEAAKHQAGEMLSEYDQTKTQDITNYDSEADTPPNVLDGNYDDDTSGYADDNDNVETEDQDRDEVSDILGSDSDSDSDNDANYRTTENLNYLNYTHDNVRVNDDPTQIASVVTAVEYEGEAGHKSADVGLDALIGNEDTESYDIDDILGNDLTKYGAADDEDDQDNNNNHLDDNADDNYDVDHDDVNVDNDEDDDGYYDNEPPDDSVFSDEHDDPDADISDPSFDYPASEDYES